MRRNVSRLSLACALAILGAACARGAVPPTIGDIRAPGATAAPGEPEAGFDPADGGLSGDPSRPSGSRAGPGETPEPTPVVHSRIPENEKVTWGQALDWWPHRPLLSFATPPTDDGRESIYVSSRKGGLKGNPRKEYCTLTVFWEIPPATAETGDYFSVTDGGGASLTLQSYPPGMALPPAGSGGRTVIVRGTITAWLFELRSDIEEDTDWQYQADRDVRYIQWLERFPRNGGQVTWLFATNPHMIDEQRAIEILNSMEEVR